MTPLTQPQVDSLMKELHQWTCDAENRTKLGLKIYDDLFNAKPELISLFPKLSGLDNSNVMQSEAIKYYARTFVENLIKMLQVAANEAELQEQIETSVVEHKKRNVSKEQFLSCECIFAAVFNKVLTDADNRQSMAAFFHHTIPAIGNQM